jgi:hypothetical protein
MEVPAGAFVKLAEQMKEQCAAVGRHVARAR